MSEHSTYEGIVVLGFLRSGTTLLRRLLNAHPNICCPPETNLLSAASRFLEEQQFAGDLSVGVVPGLGFSEFREEEVLTQLREFVFGFFRTIAARSGCKRWAEKTAHDSFYIDVIERLCGERCRYICIVRHPLDTVCSVKDLADKMLMYLPEIHEYVKRYPAPLEAFAHAWVDVNQRLGRLLDADPKTACLVRYEDLCMNPETEAGRIFDFLEEPADVPRIVAESMKKAATVGLGDWKTYQRTAIDKGSVGRWSDLDPWAIRRLSEILNPAMKRFGYPEVTPPAKMNSTTARHRYQLSRRVAQLKAQSLQHDSDAD